MPRDISGKVTVVTGASSGNGRAIAKAFGEEGAPVVVADVVEDPREGGYEDESGMTTAEVIRERGGEATFVECDVTDRDQIRAAIETAVDEFGSFDVMVNNAGIFTRLVPTWETTQDEWNKTIAVNLTGVWNGCKESIDQFLEDETQGNIINIASGGGIVGLINEPAYTASKGGVVQLTKTVALDCADHKINVNAVAPGWISTSMTREYFEDEGIREDLEQSTPWPRLGRPEDVANACTFLAAPDSEFITGSVLAADGGFTAR
ncbi:SDR family NAD(P)-dependent oxidoreductase [Halomarina ordinaria]|uniref:SDR family NAD(P)-dependent oxidoreductase n=1 Tax=Halomarina ordinaria TaxID=3033939 RepID=A0ABD5UDD7_9EURY|nr:glucose 1-dehydrogenase [Halomarina sp. PSRA2]